MIFSLFLVFLAVLLTGISQVLLKIGSAHRENQNESSLAPFLNIPTFCAYGILLFVTVISVIALKEVPLKLFYTIASLGFLVVTILSWGILKEGVNTKTVVGIILISFGVILFNI
jgi:multidrug transporter EmrE-like cation transporter